MNRPVSMRLFSVVGAVIAIAVFIQLPAVGQPRIFADSESIQSVLFQSGDLVDIQCDSVYVLNKLTFRRYDSAYKDLKKKGTSIAGLMNVYDEIIGLQDKRIREQSANYQELHSQFMSLANEAGTKISDSSIRLGAAMASMETLTKNLVETKSLLVDAREIIEAEKRGLNLEKILWGVGGVTVGIIAGVLIAK